MIRVYEIIKYYIIPKKKKNVNMITINSKDGSKNKF